MISVCCVKYSDMAPVRARKDREEKMRFHFGDGIADTLTIQAEMIENQLREMALVIIPFVFLMIASKK